MKEKLEILKKNWPFVVIAVLLLSLLFNNSFRQTISRQRMIRNARLEVDSLNLEIDATQAKIQELKTEPQQVEHLVRKELGYLRPGEKEVRIIKQGK